MSIMLTRLAKDPRASVGAEFALVLPIFLLFVLGVVDVGRMMWTWNRAEKAAQMGVRYAAVTDMADTGLADHNYYDDGVPRGSPILDDTFGAICTSTGCACNDGGDCPGIGTFSTAAFSNTVARMQAIMPEIQPENVTIEYGYSGLGYSGDPYGPDINPLITVRLSDLTFQPSLGYAFGVSVGLPSFASTLSMEDGRYAISN
jgi:hypothetical protein